MELKIKGSAGGKIQPFSTRGSFGWLGRMTLIRFGNKKFSFNLPVPDIGESAVIPIPGPIDALVSATKIGNIITVKFDLIEDMTQAVLTTYEFTDDLREVVPFRFGVGSVKIEGTIEVA